MWNWTCVEVDLVEYGELKRKDIVVVLLLELDRLSCVRIFGTTDLMLYCLPLVGRCTH